MTKNDTFRAKVMDLLVSVEHGYASKQSVVEEIEKLAREAFIETDWSRGVQGQIGPGDEYDWFNREPRW